MGHARTNDPCSMAVRGGVGVAKTSEFGVQVEYSSYKNGRTDMPEMRGGISDSVVASEATDPSRAMEHVPASVPWSVLAYCVTGVV